MARARITIQEPTTLCSVNECSATELLRWLESQYKAKPRCLDTGPAGFHRGYFVWGVGGDNLEGGLGVL